MALKLCASLVCMRSAIRYEQRKLSITMTESFLFVHNIVLGIMGAGNFRDTNILPVGSDLYSDVVLNVPLIRPSRSLIPEIRSSWPEAGVASQRPKKESVSE